jgi:hypothetical protein
VLKKKQKPGRWGTFTGFPRSNSISATWKNILGLKSGKTVIWHIEGGPRARKEGEGLLGTLLLHHANLFGVFSRGNEE